MRIVVEQVEGNEKTGFVIAFVSSLGRARAVWKGKEPHPGETYEVEIEIPAPLIRGQSIFSSDTEAFLLQEEQETVSLRGRLLSVEENSSSVLELGSTLVLLETAGNGFQVGDFVEIRIGALIVYDCNL